MLADRAGSGQRGAAFRSDPEEALDAPHELARAAPDRLALVGGCAAHVLDGAEALAAYLREWYPQRPPLVVSVMRDKDIDQILAALVPVTSEVFVTLAPSARAIPELAKPILADLVR